jgi:CubicO group peptidase (beta-lactamase class C family)
MVVEAESVAMDPQALRDVERIFNRQIVEGLHPGAALAVFRHGKPVLDLFGGSADTESGRPVTQDTMFVLFSSTKPLASTSVHILVERGQAQLDDRVAKHWPEFGRNGKENVTIRHILTHRGGFPQTPASLPWSAWGDWGAVVRAIEEAPAQFEPGTVSAYHALNHGWVCGELVRRIDGRDFATFLRAEITGPLGMNDTYVGLPDELEGRVARLHAMEDVDEQGRATVDLFNRPDLHRAVIPAGCGIATARDMARFYMTLANGGELGGVRILKPETVAAATAIAVDGEVDRAIGVPVRRGTGFNLGGLPGVPNSMGETATVRTFGHGGAGTSICWSDPDLGLGFAFIPNGFRGMFTIVPRCAELSDAVRAACR